MQSGFTSIQFGEMLGFVRQEASGLELSKDDFKPLNSESFKMTHTLWLIAYESKVLSNQPLTSDKWVKVAELRLVWDALFYLEPTISPRPMIFFVFIKMSLSVSYIALYYQTYIQYYYNVTVAIWVKIPNQYFTDWRRIIKHDFRSLLFKRTNLYCLYRVNIYDFHVMDDMDRIIRHHWPSVALILMHLLCLGWIPGLKIGITFLRRRFFLFIKCLRKSSKVNFPLFVPRELVQVWYHFKWFLKLYNLSYSDSSYMHWV